MSWLNQITLSGVVRGDVSITTYPNGALNAEFSLVTLATFTRDYDTDEASSVEREEVHKIVVLSKEIVKTKIQDLLRDGDWVTLTGRLQYRTCQDPTSAPIPYISVKRGNQFSPFVGQAIPLTKTLERTPRSPQIGAA